MTGLARISVALALCAGMAGCVAPGAPTVPSATVMPFRTRVIAEDSAINAITIGKSTRADVIAALGETLVVKFDSGYEVWVYRLASEKRAQTAHRQRKVPASAREAEPDAREFVVLVGPSGLVAKTRIRPAPTGG